MKDLEIEAISLIVISRRSNVNTLEMASPYEATAEFFFLTLFASLIFCIAYLYLKQLNREAGRHGLIKNAERFFLIASLTSLWYSISISFTVYNKWILKSYRGGGYTFPIFNTTIHLLIKLIFSRMWYHYNYSNVSLSQTLLQHQPANEIIRNDIYYKIVLPIGLATALDIIFSNEAISRISISLYTIIKSTVCGWVFMWGCISNIETFSWKKLITLCVLILGLSLAIFSDIKLSKSGMIFAIAASASGGLRWVLIQVLSTRDESCKHNACNILYKFSPASVASIIPLLFLFERSSLVFYYSTCPWHIILEISALISLGGIIACLLIVVEIVILDQTTSLTLSILGQIKEALQITFSIIAFHDSYTTESVLGVLLSLAAAEYYRRIKKQEEVKEGEGETAPMVMNMHGHSDVELTSVPLSNTRTYEEEDRGESSQLIPKEKLHYNNNNNTQRGVI